MHKFIENIKEYQLLSIGIIFSLSLLLSVFVISNTLSRSGLDVTGSAVELVKSDSASWDVSIASSSKSKKVAYDKLIQYKTTVLSYLKNKGFQDNEIEIQNTNFYPVYEKAKDTGEDLNILDRYEFNQIIKVTSNNIPLIKEASLDIEQLLGQDIDVTSNPPSYFYSKLADLKVKLLNKASEDAKKRAKAMLKSTGSHLGQVKAIKAGVFQITAPNSTDVSDYGYYDTSTIDKKVTAVIQITFRIR